MSTTQEALKLNVMLGDYPNTVALTQGKIRSDRLQLNFAEARVPHDHFKHVVKGDFDVAELAIMTYLQALSWGRPLVALPVVLHGRFQHAQIAYNADRGTLAPADLYGKRVGVRTYPQTTPTWVRGILQNDYGVDLSKIHFITFDDGHVPEYRDPPNCQRSASGKKLLQMLLDGDVDAAVLSGEDLKHPKVKPLISDPAAAGKAWHAKYGALMVNHIMVVKSGLSKSDPAAVREIYRMVKESRQASTEPAPKDGIDKRPIGYSANKRNFEVAAQYAWRQRITAKELKLDDLFDATTRALD
ncbi:MAG: ABC transporter substrate-binding protein [Betaproteobacteria bacterium]|nr:ABC transporter substrate-binding protein [Betaproteobacteria bacterium]